MSKIIVRYCLLLVTLLFPDLVSGQKLIYERDRPYKNHLQVDGLSGRVKKVIEYNYERKGVRDSVLTRDDKLMLRIVNTYNRSGNKVSTDYIRADNSLSSREEYVYVAGGLSMFKYIDGSLSYNTSFYYDQKGRLVSEVLRLAKYKDVVVSKKSYKYDLKGRLSETSRVMISDNESRVTRVSYGEKEVVLNVVNKGKEISSTSFTYDLKSGVLLKETNTFNSSTKKGPMTTVENNSYDAGGHRVSREYADGYGRTPTLEEFLYTFDKTGNWLTRVNLRSGAYSCGMFYKREISYY